MFVAATIPNLLLSPLAGTFVDRWNQRDVMIVSDLLRAAAVLIIPIAAVTSVYLVYPLIFLITSISIFFRPARVAILPRIVRDDDLLTANSALWAGETFADVIGYPLAGLFVAFLGPALPLAFWIDAATYAASAMLIALDRGAGCPTWRHALAASPEAAVADPGVDAARLTASLRHPPNAGRRTTARQRRPQRQAASCHRDARGLPLPAARAGPVREHDPGGVRPVRDRIADRADPDVRRARSSRPANRVGPEAAYAFLETSIGLGNLIGGFVIGLVGMRLAKGRMVIGGYVLWGVALIAFALSGNLRPRPRDPVRGGHRKHDLRHPEPDALPAPNAARADRTGRRASGSPWSSAR